jgi:hypothetical protein
VEFISKFGELAMKMMISDPPLVFEFGQIGKKVQFNQHKQDSLDGFIKTGEDCLVIIPPVYKLIPSTSSNNSIISQNGTNTSTSNGMKK